MPASLAHGLDFEDLFDLAPVSLWMEDYSQLKALVEQWRAQGVTDLMAFLAEDPSRLQQCHYRFQVLRVNQCTLELFKAPDQQTFFSRLHEVFRDEITEGIESELMAMWDNRLTFRKHAINYDLEGRRLNVVVNVRVLPGYEQDWSRILVSLEDVTTEMQSTLRLLRSEQYARDLFEQSPVSLWVEDFSRVKALLDTLRETGVQDLRSHLQQHPNFVTRCISAIHVIDVNRQTLELFAAHSHEELQRHLLQIMQQDVQHSFAEQLIDLWNGKLVHQREVMNYSLSGELLHIHLEFAVMTSHQDNWGRVLLSLVDITPRKRAESYLEYLSQHDVLTQLYNRSFYTEHLELLAQQGPWPISVIAMDLNGLKTVNDAHGHAAGDAMLRRMGEVLQQVLKTLPTSACAARIGGDEFMLLLPGMAPHEAQRIQMRIMEALDQNNLQHPHAPIAISMGCACGSAGDSLDAVVHLADQAMYAEKARFYSNQHFNRRLGTT